MGRSDITTSQSVENLRAGKAGREKAYMVQHAMGLWLKAS